MVNFISLYIASKTFDIPFYKLIWNAILLKMVTKKMIKLDTFKKFAAKKD